MDFKNVNHLREVLKTDTQGNSIGAMQYSTRKISCVRPTFVDVPLAHQARARELYFKSGGRRREGMKIGTAAILDFAELGEIVT